MIAGVLLLWAGCTVGPDYVKPPTAAPAAYKETPGWKVAQPRDELSRGAWWEIYDDPQVERPGRTGRHQQPEHRRGGGAVPPGPGAGEGSPGRLFSHGYRRGVLDPL